ncbi:uncharacterized protein LOC100982577 [Pan paniscus]|uniref:uncharacterized protein LOC100982577 n=1 Tax=Pan paniscus TaxID=9597 RepID=UPI0023F41BE3|nr:uncharacterized protein LOC100982577 [Pan paniscus]XP_016785203.2 uncharacterized protein LOC741498 [Pan troglodytes]
MGARRQPRAPAPGPRLRVRAQHPGKVGGRRWRKDARAVSRHGRGNCGAFAILSPSPYLRPRGRAHHPPSRLGGGRAPSWPPPSRPLNSPGDCGYCHRLASTASSRSTQMRTVGGEKGQTLLPANRRCRSRGLTKMAAAVSAATTTTTTTTRSESLSPARPVFSRETITQ